MSTLVDVKNLSRYYGDFCAVKNVSFSLNKGEVLGFLGPNGAGKSTTMKMICGNLAPTIGEIKINGFDMLDEPKLAKAELGFLPEIPPLYRDLTVDEYLSYCGKLHGLKSNAVQKAVTHGKEKCGLGDVGKRLINNLSKGYQQRVGIAQAILHNPSVIILDEPTVGLDPIQIMEIRQLIKDLGSEHSVILSTHILPEVQQSCDRVQIIHQGQLVLSDSIENLNAQMNSSKLNIRLSHAADIDKIKAVSGITAIDEMNENHYQIHHQQQFNPAQAVAELAVTNHWGLLELTPVKNNMEDIFISLTQNVQNTEKAS